jgi:carbon-monoxide dehydrogenase large subunit
VVRSPVPHGRVVAIRTEAAKALPGVRDLITAEDVPDLRIPIRMGWTFTEDANRVTQPPLARDRVRYVGEPVAVVVADDPYAAEDAADEVWVEIEEHDPVVDTHAAIDPAAPVLHPELGRNVIDCLELALGDVDEAFAHAEIVVSDRFHVQRHMAVPLETRGLVAEFDADSGRLTVWGAAKVKHFNRATVSAMLGLAEDRIRMIEGNVGGGFGARGEFYPEDFLVPFLAMRLRRPVKWVEDRAEHFVATNHSRELDAEIEMAATGDGRLLAFRARMWSSQGAYVRTHGIILAVLPVLHLPGPYAWEGFRMESQSVATNKTPAGTYRGPGIVEATFVRERMVDRIAGEVGLEPAELRARNLIPAAEMPFHIASDPLPMIYDSGDYGAFWRQLLEEGRYADLRGEQAERRARGELVGVGLAAFVEHGAVGPYEQARIVPEDAGTFTVQVGVGSVGQGVETALGQIAADELGVEFEKVRIGFHDTDLTPEGFGAFASRATVLGGNAIAVAACDLREKALEAAAVSLSAAPAELELEGGVVWNVDRSASVALADLGVAGEGRFEKEEPSVSFGAAFVLANVEPETGRVRVPRCVVAFDVGRAVNPALLRGQLAGAAAQGLAGTLFEELVYSEDGQPQSTSFADYLMPTLAELPDVDVIILEHDVQGNPLGLKGGGEGGINGVPAAVANAVADALGVSVARLPLTPEAVRTLLRGRVSGHGRAAGAPHDRAGKSGGLGTRRVISVTPPAREDD